MVTSILGILLAAFKAIPPLKDLWDQIVVEYTTTQLANMKKENALAIRKAIFEKDQRDLEKLLDPTKSGEASGLPGSEIRHDLPGIKS